MSAGLSRTPTIGTAASARTGRSGSGSGYGSYGLGGASQPSSPLALSSSVLLPAAESSAYASTSASASSPTTWPSSPSTRLYLAIDCGGTKAAACVSDGYGTLLGRGLGGAANYTDVGLTVFLRSVRTAVDAAMLAVAAHTAAAPAPHEDEAAAAVAAALREKVKQWSTQSRGWRRRRYTSSLASIGAGMEAPSSVPFPAPADEELAPSPRTSPASRPGPPPIGGHRTPSMSTSTADASGGVFEAAWFGVAGVDSPVDVENLSPHLASLLSLPHPSPRLIVANDTSLLAAPMHDAAYPHIRNGVVTIAGTGSIVMSYRSDPQGGNLRTIGRAGGWGWLLGDEGSGYAVGRDAVRKVLEQADRERIQRDYATHASWQDGTAAPVPARANGEASALEIPERSLKLGQMSHALRDRILQKWALSSTDGLFNAVYGAASPELAGRFQAAIHAKAASGSSLGSQGSGSARNTPRMPASASASVSASAAAIPVLPEQDTEAPADGLPAAPVAIPGAAGARAPPSAQSSSGDSGAATRDGARPAAQPVPLRPARPRTTDSSTLDQTLPSRMLLPPDAPSMDVAPDRPPSPVPELETSRPPTPGETSDESEGDSDADADLGPGHGMQPAAEHEQNDATGSMADGMDSDLAAALTERLSATALGAASPAPMPHHANGSAALPPKEAATPSFGELRSRARPPSRRQRSEDSRFAPDASDRMPHPHRKSSSSAGSVALHGGSASVIVPSQAAGDEDHDSFRDRKHRLASLAPIVFHLAFNRNDALSLEILRSQARQIALQILDVVRPDGAALCHLDPDASVLCMGGSLLGVEKYQQLLIQELAKFNVRFARHVFTQDPARGGAAALARIWEGKQTADASTT